MTVSTSSSTNKKGSVSGPERFFYDKSSYTGAHKPGREDQAGATVNHANFSKQFRSAAEYGKPLADAPVSNRRVSIQQETAVKKALVPSQKPAWGAAGGSIVAAADRRQSITQAIVDGQVTMDMVAQKRASEIVEKQLELRAVAKNAGGAEGLKRGSVAGGEILDVLKQIQDGQITPAPIGSRRASVGAGVAPVGAVFSPQSRVGPLGVERQESGARTPPVLTGSVTAASKAKKTNTKAVSKKKEKEQNDTTASEGTSSEETQAVKSSKTTSSKRPSNDTVVNSNYWVEDVLKKSEDRFVDWETLAQFQQQMRKSLQEINEKAEKALAQSDVSAGQIVDLRTQLKAEFKDIKELICSIAAGNNNAMSDGNMSTCASPMSEQAAVKA